MSTQRVRIAVFDDGTPTSVVACERAIELADELLIVHLHESPQRDHIEALAGRAEVSATLYDLERHEGIRHALAVAAAHGVSVAYVPAPDEHPGEMLRKCVQAVGQAGDELLPALAVRFVRPDSRSGPVVEVTPARTDAGFVALFAIALAISTEKPLHILRLDDDEVVLDDVELRATEALDDARRLIAADVVPVLDEHSRSADWLADVLAQGSDASAVVVGLGGVEVRGRKWTAPSQLPDAVLETRSGNLVHELLRHLPTDLVVVIDAVSLRHGILPGAAAATTVTAALGAGALVGVPVGLAVFTAGLAVSGAGLASAATADDS